MSKKARISLEKKQEIIKKHIENPDITQQELANLFCVSRFSVAKITTDYWIEVMAKTN